VAGRPARRGADGYGTGGIQEERTVLDPSSSVWTCLDDNL
jgi:hypothetical protein